MIAFYNSASVEFESAASRIATNQHGRTALDKVSMIVSSAVPRIPSGAVTAFGDAFYFPDSNSQIETYGVDFISNMKFLDETALTEVIYAFDKNDPSVATYGNYTTLYRYRLAWSGNSKITATSAGPFPLSGVPDNCMYLERLQLNPVVVSGTTVLEASQTQEPGTSFRILMRDIYRCKFRRTSVSSLLIRVSVYGIDPDSGKLLDGTLSRDMRRVRRDGKAGSTGNTLFDITGAVPLPALTLTPNN